MQATSYQGNSTNIFKQQGDAPMGCLGPTKNLTLHNNKNNETYRRIRNCVYLDFDWLRKINAQENSETGILYAICNLKEENFNDPETKKAAEILSDKECRSVFVKSGLLHVLRILSYSTLKAATSGLQPPLEYFNKEAGQRYESLTAMYDQLMPKNLKLDQVEIFSTSQEEFNLNYKLYKANLLPAKNPSNLNQQDTLFQSNSTLRLSTTIGVTETTGSENTFRWTEQSSNTNRTPEQEQHRKMLETHVGCIGSIVKAQISQANSNFEVQNRRLQQEIKQLEDKLDEKTRELEALERFRTCFQKEIKENIIERVKKAWL